MRMVHHFQDGLGRLVEVTEDEQGRVTVDQPGFIWKHVEAGILVLEQLDSTAPPRVVNWDFYRTWNATPDLEGRKALAMIHFPDLVPFIDRIDWPVHPFVFEVVD